MLWPSAVTSTTTVNQHKQFPRQENDIRSRCNNLFLLLFNFHYEISFLLHEVLLLVICDEDLQILVEKLV